MAAVRRWRRVVWAAAVFALAGARAHAERREGERAPTFWVAPDGEDRPSCGTAERPWATIRFALETAPDGSTILVRPGTYRGKIGVDRKLARGIQVRAAQRYRAVLRHHDVVFRCRGCEGVTLQGFDIAHDGPGAGPLVVQIDGDGGAGGRRVTLRDNVIHDSLKNDLLKINNGARDVLVQGNVFYDQSGSDEHIDINSVDGVIVEDNVFFNDFEGSGRRRPEDTSSFIVIKDSNGDEDGIEGARRVTVRRNVFLGWQGGRAYGFILVGEDGKPYFEAEEILVENNLLIGDSPVAMRAPFGVKGARRAVFRNNTIVGDLPGSAFAARINREGENRRGEEVRFYNNVWADPTGTMDDFSDSPPEDVGSVELSHNLYWNGGSPIPYGRDDAVNFIRDRGRVIADPRLPTPRSVRAPRWVPERGTFADGSRTVAGARRALIERWGKPDRRSAVVDRGDAAKSPREDILGRPRGGAPDIGAYEVDDRPAQAALRGAGAER